MPGYRPDYRPERYERIPTKQFRVTPHNSGEAFTFPAPYLSAAKRHANARLGPGVTYNISEIGKGDVWFEETTPYEGIDTTSSLTKADYAKRNLEKLEALNRDKPPIRALDLAWTTPTFYIDKKTYIHSRRVFIETGLPGAYDQMLGTIHYWEGDPPNWATEFTHELMDKLMDDPPEPPEPVEKDRRAGFTLAPQIKIKRPTGITAVLLIYIALIYVAAIIMGAT